MKIFFEKKYYLLQGKEYLIRNCDDEDRVLEKQKKIHEKTGKKPQIVISLRNG